MRYFYAHVIGGYGLHVLDKKAKEEALRNGTGSYYVKIAASGRGAVYHHPECGRCRSTSVLEVSDAKALGYVLCGVCGGEPQFILNRDSGQPEEVLSNNRTESKTKEGDFAEEVDFDYSQYLTNRRHSRRL